MMLGSNIGLPVPETVLVHSMCKRYRGPIPVIPPVITHPFYKVNLLTLETANLPSRSDYFWPFSQAKDIAGKMLADLYGTVRGAWRIVHLPSGQPVALLGDEPGPSISLSHSRGWLACAVSGTGTIGVDVEVMRSGRDWRGIARAAFGPREIARAATEHEFYRIWTLREALAKANGRGLDHAADGVDRVHLGPSEGIWSTASSAEIQLFHHHAPRPGVFLSVAVLGLKTAQIAEVLCDLHITVAYLDDAECAETERKGELM